MVETQNRHLGLGSPCHWKQLAGRGRMMISWGVSGGVLALDGAWTRSEVIQLEPLVNEILLEHSHAPSFMYYLWLLLCYYGRAKTMTQTVWPAESKIVTLWSLEKTFANPWTG